MDKLTSNSAILRSEVKTETDFNLLVAVARASGMTLAVQAFDKLDEYNGQYFGFDYPEVCLQDKDLLRYGNELISFEDAVFSLAEPEWTHIYRGKGTGSFYYGNDKGKHFNISENARTSCSTADFSNYTLIATREPQVVESPKPKFAVGDVIKHKGGYTEYTVLYIDEVSAAVKHGDGASRCFIQASVFDGYEKVIPLRNQVISLVEHVDPSSYFDDIADAILARFNVTEKS